MRWSEMTEIKLSCKERIWNTIATIEYSDEYEQNWELFNKGINILKKHDCKTEFEDKDRETLEVIFSLIYD